MSKFWVEWIYLGVVKLSKVLFTCWLVVPLVQPKVGLEFGTTDLWYAQAGIDGLVFNQLTNQLFAFWALVIAEGY